MLSTAFSGNAIRSTGLGLAFDEINADLRGLDGGGTFLKAADVKTRLNRFVPDTYGVISTMITVDGTFTLLPLPTGPHSTPDLRRFFLVVLDEQKRVMPLAAIAALNGSECQ